MDKQMLAERLRRDLGNVMAERREAALNPALQAARMALKRFQVQRMVQTHADLVASPVTHAAARFFLDDLYGPGDVTQRDASLERIIPTMEKLLPPSALATVAEAIALDALSERLDRAMASVLGEQFSEEAYLAAYVKVTSRTEREMQIALVDSVGRALCDLVRVPMIGATLSLMRRPAKAANLAELQAFLERGWKAFKAMKDPSAFVQAVVRREQAILERIYAGDLHPFRTIG